MVLSIRAQDLYFAFLARIPRNEKKHVFLQIAFHFRGKHERNNLFPLHYPNPNKCFTISPFCEFITCSRRTTFIIFYITTKCNHAFFFEDVLLDAAFCCNLLHGNSFQEKPVLFTCFYTEN